MRKVRGNLFLQVLTLIFRLSIILLIIYFLWNIYNILSYAKKVDDMQPMEIVVLGDSIWDNFHGDTGIDGYTKQQLKNKIRIYNCAIGGTSAAYRELCEGDVAWNEMNLLSITEYLSGVDIPFEHDATQQIIDARKASPDFVIIAYGLNDYFLGIKRESLDGYDQKTYEGALRTAIDRIKVIYPGARIIIEGQTYCQAYSYGKVYQESDYTDYGGGIGPDYVRSAEKIADEYGAIFINNYELMGINITNGLKYLSDAVHLTETGRKRYSTILVRKILDNVKTE